MFDRFLRRTGMKLLRAGFNADNNDMEKNGEAWFIRKIAPDLRQVIDVGFNHGSYTKNLIKIAPHTQILGIEPIPEFYEKASSWLPDNVLLKNLALGADEDTVTIYKKGSGASASPGPARGKDFVRHDIQCMPGDKLVAQMDFGPAQHIKIDTDGYDMPVIHGFASSIKTWRPTIQFEFGRYWLETGHRLKEAVDLFSSLDYELGYLKKNYIEPLKYSYKNEVYFLNLNFIALPKEKSQNYF